MKDRNSEELEKDQKRITKQILNSSKRRQSAISFNPELSTIEQSPITATTDKNSGFIPNGFSYDESVSSERNELLPANTEKSSK